MAGARTGWTFRGSNRGCWQVVRRWSVSAGWWSPAFGQGSALPWLVVVGVGESLVAERGDTAAGVAVTAGTAGVGQVA
jgi:hypothetical protein